MAMWIGFMSNVGSPDGLIAYLDPGAGSIILQGILAGIAMLAVVAKVYWRKLLVFLRLREAPPKEVDVKEGADGASRRG